ncbi:hypothetical protein [Streptomyces sp. 6N106]|uniref:hypothetical protein n=1 Tax=Streptomyces sp. 6N106 TaxID=3457418 RepID=UPI003FD5199A
MRGIAAESGGVAAADAVLDPCVAVADLQVPQRAFTIGGVGEEDLVAHAVVQAGQGQLGARIRAFPADDDPCADRISS